MDRQWNRLVGYFVGIAILSVVVFLTPNIFGGSWFPDVNTIEGARNDKLSLAFAVMSVVIFAGVAAFIVYSLVHFTVKPGQQDDGLPIHGHHRLEMGWTIAFTVLVFAVAFISWEVMRDNEKPKPDRHVNVRAFQFGWAFSYPGVKLESAEGTDVEEAAELVIPLDEVIRYDVLSCSRREATGNCFDRYGKPLETVPNTNDANDVDVNHAFWVPEARLKIDAVSGVHTWTQFTSDKVTTADQHPQVVCAELCGSGHNAMRVDTCVVEKAVFDWWTVNADATCATMKYFNCREAKSSGEKLEVLREKIDDLLVTNDNATCSELGEAV